MHPESATSPIWLNQTIEVNGFNGRPLFCPLQQQYSSSSVLLLYISLLPILRSCLNQWTAASQIGNVVGPLRIIGPPLFLIRSSDRKLPITFSISTPICVTTAVSLPGPSVTTTAPVALQGSGIWVSLFSSRRCWYIPWCCRIFGYD